MLTVGGALRGRHLETCPLWLKRGTSTSFQFYPLSHDSFRPQHRPVCTVSEVSVLTDGVERYDRWRRCCT